MTRKELAERIQTFEKGRAKWEWPFIFVFIIGLIIIGALFIEPSTHSNWIAALGIVAVFLWIMVPIPVAKRMTQKRMRELGLICPKCGAWLFHETGRLAVATQHCCKCGEKILEDDPN